MGFFEPFTFSEDKLIVFYVGGRAPGCHLELHDVMFFVGSNSEEMARRLKANWFGTPKTLHVDSWYALENVDGYDIVLDQGEPPNNLKLFFVNLGAYKKGVFGELHFMSFVVAESVNAVKAKAKKNLERELVELHTDDLYELDDLIELTAVDGRNIHLRPGEKKNCDPINGWQRVV